MAEIPKISRDAALNQVLAFSKKEKEIRSVKSGSKAEEKVEEGFDLLIQNLMELKEEIKGPGAFRGEATLEVDENMIDKIAKALKFFETPAKTRQREEKMRILQGALFWEKLFGFQTLLENLQDKRLKRGQKVEKVSKSDTRKK